MAVQTTGTTFGLILGTAISVSVKNKIVDNNTPTQPPLPKPTKKRGSNEKFEYSQFAIELMVYCIAADGEIKDTEIKIAEALIDSDEFILDKRIGKNELKLRIDEVTKFNDKTLVYLRLKHLSLQEKAKQIYDRESRDRLKLILREMVRVDSSTLSPEIQKMLLDIDTAISK